MLKRETGIYGEKLAVRYLRRQGWEILALNYRELRCEVDIVAWDGDTLVFVEVKTRTGDSFGTGAEAVNKGKQHNLIKAAECYMYKNRLTDVYARFDVMEIDANTGNINHIKNAFEV